MKHFVLELHTTTVRLRDYNNHPNVQNEAIWLANFAETLEGNTCLYNVF